MHVVYLSSWVLTTGWNLHLKPLLDFAVPVADKAGGAADDDTLGHRFATKQFIA